MQFSIPKMQRRPVFHKVPIPIRTYSFLGPSEENVLHTNNADSRVQDNPFFSAQMVQYPIKIFIYFLGPNGKWIVLHVTNVCLRPNDDQSKKQQCFLKIVRSSVYHAQLALAFFRNILQLCGRFLFTRYKLCLCLQKNVRSEWLKPHFGTNSPKLAKLKHMRRNDKLWKNEEMKNYGNMMKQYYL